MLHPRWTLAELLGPEVVFNSATSYLAPGLRRALGRPRLDLGSGAGLAIAGGVRVVCSRATVGDRSRVLLEESGFTLPPLTTFGSPEEYRSWLSGANGGAAPVAFQFVHAKEECATERYWVARDVLVRLNDKASLPDLVPVEHLPPGHASLDPAALSPDHPSVRRLPVVLKASTEEATSGGTAVRICRSRDDVTAALRAFAGSRRIVVERFLEIERNVCVQFAVTPDRRIVDLGASEQVVDEHGVYHGNWFDARDGVHRGVRELGRTIAARAAEQGYRGIAGFDIVIGTDGRLFALDLNFRICGSTLGLLLLDAIAARFDAPVVRNRLFTVDGEAGLDTARDAIRRGRLLALMMREPPDPAEPILLAGLVPGRSRSEVETIIAELARRGLTCGT